MESSLSVDETNALRAKLGLKPLANTSGSSSGGGSTALTEDEKRDIAARKYLEEQDRVEKEKAAKALEEKLAMKKEARRIEEKLRATKTLGSDEDEDAGSWVQKLRQKEEEKKKAQQRARMLAEMDEELTSSSAAPAGAKPAKKLAGKGAKQPVYSSSHLKGLKVAHDADDIQTGDSLVLILKDTDVLDDENEDVLENVNLRDDEKAKASVMKRNKQDAYNPHETLGDDFPNDTSAAAAFMKGPKDILSQYDDWENELKGDRVPPKKAFVIGEAGRADLAGQREEEEILASMRGTAVTLEMDKFRATSDFYTKEEMVAFKKPTAKKQGKKQRRPREKLADDDDDETPGSLPSSSKASKRERENDDNEGDGDKDAGAAPRLAASDLPSDGADHDGAHSDRGSRKKARLDEPASGGAGSSNNKNGGAPIVSLAAPGAYKPLKPKVDDTFEIAVDEEGAAELHRAVERTRRLKMSATASIGEDAVISGVARAESHHRPAGAEEERQARQAANSAGESDSAIVFSSTSEFVRSLANQQDNDESDTDARPMDTSSSSSSSSSSAGQNGVATVGALPIAKVGVSEQPKPRQRRTKLLGEDDEEALAGKQRQNGDDGNDKDDDKNLEDDFVQEESTLNKGVAAALAFVTKRGLVENPDKQSAVVIIETSKGKAKERQKMTEEEERQIELEVRKQREAEREQDRRERRSDYRDRDRERDRDRRGDRERDRDDPFAIAEPLPEIRLDYVDEQGRELSQKEAFKVLSYKFHGVKPGKNKEEKRMRKLEEERMLKQMSSTDTPLHTVEAAYKKMQQAGTPFIELSRMSDASGSGGSGSGSKGGGGGGGAASGFSSVRK